MRDEFHFSGRGAKVTINNGPVAGELIEPPVLPLDLDSPSLSEFDLITARHRVVPYVKATQDFPKELSAWCRDDTDGRVSARLLTGGVGSGKTRLAAELCQVMAGEGWAAGFATSDPDALAGALPKKPLLIVFDYTEVNPKLARSFLDRAIQFDHQQILTHPMRVVLVARPDGDWLSSLLVSRPVKTLLKGRPPVVLAAADFDQTARLAHRDAAFERFTRADMHPVSGTVAPDVDGDGYDTPLMVHIAALLAAKGETLPNPDSGDVRTALLDNLIDREISHLKDSLADFAEGINLTDLRTALSIATLTTPTPVEAVKLLTVDGRWNNQPPHIRQHVADMIHIRHNTPSTTVSDGEARKPIAAIEPDMISEHLTATLDGRTATIARLFTQQELRPEHRARLLSLLALTGDHYPEVRNDLDAHLADNLQQLIDDPTAVTSLHGLLVDRLPQLLHTAVDQATSDQRPEAAAQLAVALDQYPQDPFIGRVAAATNIDIPHPNRYLAHLAVAYRQHQADHRRGFGRSPVLARTLIDLAEWLGAVGRRGEALDVAEEAVNMCRILVWGNGIHQPNLAEALRNFATRLGAVGRRGEALDVAEEAVAICRDLARDDPFYLPAFAMARHTLAIRLGEVGRRREAVGSAGEAVAIYRGLAEGNPAAYLPNFAASLTNLALDLGQVGRGGEALGVAEEAVAIYRGLAGDNPVAYLPDLAASLTNLAIRLGAVGRSGEALVMAEEATTICRVLAEGNPAAYLPNLAASLTNLANRLDSAGRWDDGLVVAEEATAIYRGLAEDNPAVYFPDLAASLTNLANRLDSAGRWDDGLVVAETTVTVYRGLAGDRSSYLPAFAMALHTLAIRLGVVGRQYEGLVLAEEAVTICRDLARGHSSYLPAFAMALHTLAIRLGAVGRQGEALAVAEEAVTIYRGLAGDHPASHPPDLIISPSNFAVDLGAVGGQGKSVAVAEEVVTTYRSLFEANPEADVGNFVTSLVTLVRLLVPAGRREEAQLITYIAQQLS